MKRRTSSRIFSKGSILVAVLGLIALLSALLISFMQEAVARIRFNGALDNGTDLRERAYSGLEISLASIAQIAEIDNGLRSASQGWNDPLGYAGFEPYDDCKLEVTVEDEQGKLPLSAMSETQLTALFDQMEISHSTSDKLAQALLDWMDPDDTARLSSIDGDDYEKADIPCKPTNAVPRSWDEFIKIYGFKEILLDEHGKPTDIFKQLMASVSLHNDGDVNVNDANELTLDVLGYLGGFDADRALKKMEGSDMKRGTLYDNILSTTTDLGTGTSVPMAAYSTQLLHIRVVASRGDARFTLDALLKYKGASTTSSAASSTTTTSKLNGGYDDFPKDPASSLSYPFSIVQLVETRTAP